MSIHIYDTSSQLFDNARMSQALSGARVLLFRANVHV